MKKSNRLAPTLMINGKEVTVNIDDGMKPAHGTGLDGKTKVKSLSTGSSLEYPGQTFLTDVQGNSIMATPDEMFVALKQAAPGWKITATRNS